MTVTRPARSRFAPRLALAAVLSVASLSAFWSLGDAPIHLGADEARFALHAHALATTGRDRNGTLLPLFFHITNPVRADGPSPTWWQPTLFYLMAGVMQVMPLNEWTVRAPTAIVSILNVWLVFLVARRWLGSDWYGVLAAGMLALTPGHVIFARQAQDYLLAVPFVLGWLWCLTRLLSSDERSQATRGSAGHAGSWPLATGLVLGLGLYTHISSWVAMPLLLTVTIVALWRFGRPRSALLATAAGFVIALIPLVPWLWVYPSLPQEMLTNYRVRSALRLVERVDVYWSYFNPSFLFFSGGSNPMFATRSAGVFLLALAALVPVGIWRAFTSPHSRLDRLLVIGLLLVPIPVVLALPEDAKFYTPRALVFVPFAVLLATSGAQWLLAQPNRWRRMAAIVILGSMPWQYGQFFRHYLGEYQDWSAPRFDPFNTRAAVDRVLALTRVQPVAGVLLSEEFGEPHAQRWVFYLAKHGREELGRGTRLTPPQSFCEGEAPRGTLLVVEADGPRLGEIRQSTGCEVIGEIAQPNGSPASAIVQRR